MNWNEIAGKPSLFPPEEHTHHPDDLAGTRNSDYSARGSGAGYAVGRARIDANATALQIANIAAATIFYSVASGKIAKLIICGQYAGTDVFVDEILVCTMGASSVVEQVKKDVLGTPGARTYSIVGSDVKLSLAGAPPLHTYDIDFVAIYLGG